VVEGFDFPRIDVSKNMINLNVLSCAIAVHMLNGGTPQYCFGKEFTCLNHGTNSRKVPKAVTTMSLKNFRMVRRCGGRVFLEWAIPKKIERIIEKDI
jgi:hypothetical protein